VEHAVIEAGGARQRKMKLNDCAGSQTEGGHKEGNIEHSEAVRKKKKKKPNGGSLAEKAGHHLACRRDRITVLNQQSP